MNAAQALSAVDYVLPALEIIDSRIRDWKIGLIDTVADNASAGGVVLGSRPVPVDAVDLRLSGCVLTRRGEIVGTGAGGAVLGSPSTPWCGWPTRWAGSASPWSRGMSSCPARSVPLCPSPLEIRSPRPSVGWAPSPHDSPTRKDRGGHMTATATAIVGGQEDMIIDVAIHLSTRATTLEGVPA